MEHLADRRDVPTNSLEKDICDRGAKKLSSIMKKFKNSLDRFTRILQSFKFFQKNLIEFIMEFIFI